MAETPNKVLELCGSFWTEYYRSAVPAAYANAYALCFESVRPPRDRTGRWQPIRIYADEKVDGTSDSYRLSYGYPINVDFTPTAALFSPASTGHVKLLGTDFYIADDYIWFFTNPFSLSEFTSKSTTLGGRNFGVVWLAEASSATPGIEAQDNAYLHLVKEIARITAAPAATADGIVLAVKELYDKTVVVTTEEAAVLPAGASAVVAVGDEVSIGDRFGDSWRLTRLGPGAPSLSSVAIPTSRLLGSGYTGDLVWHNVETAVVVDTVTDKTRVRWALGGDIGDVTDFWSAVHARAVAGGVSLASCLDTRATPTGEPTAADLPNYINPAEFLCDLLGGAVYILETYTSKLGSSALTASERADVLKTAAGPLAAIFEYQNGMPTTAATL